MLLTHFLNMQLNNREADPMPTWLVEVCWDVLLGSRIKIINTCLSSGRFSTNYETAIVKSPIKKNSYQPVSNMSPPQEYSQSRTSVISVLEQEAGITVFHAFVILCKDYFNSFFIWDN